MANVNFSNSNLSFDSNLASLLQKKPFKVGEVIQTESDYAALNPLMAALNSAMPGAGNAVQDAPYTTPNREYSIFRRGNPYVSISNIKTRTLVGGNGTLSDTLKLTLQLPNNTIRINDTVKDTTSTLARVLDVQQNGLVVVIKCTGSQSDFNSTLFSAAAFAANTTFNNLWYTTESDNGDRTRPSLYVFPNEIQVFTQVSSDIITIDRDGMQALSWMEASNGQNYYAWEQQMELYNRFFYAQEMRDLTGIQNFQDGSHRTMGLVPITKVEGAYGIYLDPVIGFEASLKNIMKVSKRKAGVTGTRRMVILAGVDFIANFQNMLGTNYIQYAGSENTFGVTTGLQGQYYKYLNTEIQLVEYAALSNGSYDSTISQITGSYKSASMAIGIDVSPVKTNRGTRPAIYRTFHDNKVLRQAFKPGMVSREEMLNGISVNSLSQNGSFPIDGGTLASNFVDGCTFAVQTDYGFDIAAPNKHFVLEIAI